MFKFILKLIVFLLPLSILFIFPLSIYWLSREFTSVQQVIHQQNSSDPVLFGLAYGTATQAYKEDLVAARKPTVIALGSSRVMEFRGSFFKDPQSFVNAGGAVSDTADLAPTLELLANEDPNLRVVILGLDPEMFKPGLAPPNEEQQVSLLARLRAFFSGNWLTPYGDYTQGKFTMRELIDQHDKSPNIGLNALIDQNGFTNDGSYYYGSTVGSATAAQEMEESDVATVSQINADRSSFEYGTTTDVEDIAGLDQMLAIARSRDITVVAFIPPFQPSVYAELTSTDDAYDAELQALPKDLAKQLDTYGYTLLNVTDAHVVGITDTEFINSTHATDKADLRILIDMARQDPALQPYISLSSLETLLNNTPGAFILKYPRD
jgi:hypothetical protein